MALVPVAPLPPCPSSLALSPASSPLGFFLGAPGFLWYLPLASLTQTPLWVTTLCQVLLPLLSLPSSPLITHCLVFFAAWPSLEADPQTGQFSSRGMEPGFL